MRHIMNYKLFENNGLAFKKRIRKEGLKTDVYDVIENGIIIGQIKWYSRMRGYAFLPNKEIEPVIKDFINDLMTKRRKEKKNTK